MSRPLLFFFIFLQGIGAKAQLCNGSLGDPAVNITFSAGSNFNYKAPDSYIYTSSTCPNDGYYTITGATSNCFNAWHTITNDHTGGGNFLLVNATYDPGDFFVSTVTDLCPGTTYEFAAWIMNVIKQFGSILPDITFSIETPGGTVLQSFNTGGIPVASIPEWKQYGFFFTTPATNAAIVLRMKNNAPGGIGNDIAMDDITFRPCGSKIDAAVTGNATDTVNVCEGNTNSYTFNSNGSAGYISPLYQWQLSSDKGITWKDIAGATSLSYLRPATASPGNYWYRITVIEASVATVSSCRIASNLMIINVHPNPVVNAGADRVMILGYPATLNGEAEGEQITFEWSPDNFINDKTILDPTISPPSDITYTLSAVSAFGCMDDDKTDIKVVAGIFVPTAFSPNADGKNDVWQIPFLDPSYEGEVKIFNRWGQLIYHIKDAIVSWDGTFNGKPQPSGIYIYTVNFRKGNYKNMRGTVTLVR